MSVYARGGAWWIHFCHRGREVRRSARTTDRAVAQRLHDELKARVWKEVDSGKTLADALTAWLEERPRGGSDVRTVRHIRDEYPNRPLVDVTPASLMETFGHKSPPTYNRLVTIIRSAMNIAESREWIKPVPKFPRRKVAKQSFRWLTRKEWGAVYAELADHLKPMALFAVATGLRWSNVANLTWDNVDLRRKLAWISAGDAKGAKAISIPLADAALDALRLAGTRKGFVFVRDGMPIKSPKTGWHAAVKRAGIPPARWHDLRHTWASWHVQSGTELMVLMQLGGWASLDQVQIYAHLAPSAAARFADNARVPRRKAA